MVSRRSLLTTALGAAGAASLSGCLSRIHCPDCGGPLRHDEDARAATLDDLALEAIERGESGPLPDDRPDGELVWMRNDADEPVSLNGVEVAYPDGHEHTLGTRISVVLDPGSTLSLYTRELTTYRTLGSLGHSVRHQDPPAFTDAGPVTVTARDGERLELA